MAKKQYNVKTSAVAATERRARKYGVDWRSVGAGGYIDVAGDVAAKLDRGVFESMFERVVTGTDDDGNEKWYIRAKATLVSVGDVVAYGASDFTSAGGGSSTLANLKDVLLGTPMDGDVIKYDASLGKWVNGQGGGGLDESQLAAYLQQHNYVTEAALGNYVTIDTEQTITGKKTFGVGKWAIAPYEADDITDRTMANGTWGDGSGGLTSIRHGLDFRWYDTHWVIGNVRDGAAGTNGFGVGLLNQNGRLDIGARITTGGIYSNAFKKIGGTSSQFLKADGSVDSRSFLLNCGTLSGNIDSDYGEGIVTFDPTPSGTPPLSTPNITLLSMGPWSRRKMLAFPWDTDEIYLRRHNDSAMFGWSRVLLSSNYTGILDNSAYFRCSKYWNVHADNISNGVGFSYANGCPLTGPVLDFGCSGYGIQFNADYSTWQERDMRIYYRTKDGDSGTWHSWYELARAKDLAAYLPLSGGAMSNTNVVSNLNADLLDGCHNGDVTAKVLRINNAAGESSCFQFMQQSSGWKAWESPDQNWRHVIKLNHGNGDTYYNRTLAFDFFGYRIYTGKMEGGGFAGWKTIAFLDDNVASASKLQTARTLYITSYNSYRAGDGVAFDGTGDVMLKLPNSITASDWFRSYGASGWYNESYGGGIYMTDSTWVRVFNGKSFYCPSNILAGGDVTAYSDARLKSDIRPLTNRGFIEPKTYIKDGKRSIGFLAQDVMAIYPELVTETGGADNWLALNYGNLVAVLEAQIIDIDTRLKRLEAKA